MGQEKITKSKFDICIYVYVAINLSRSQNPKQSKFGVDNVQWGLENGYINPKSIVIK